MHSWVRRTQPILPRSTRKGGVMKQIIIMECTECPYCDKSYSCLTGICKHPDMDMSRKVIYYKTFSTDCPLEDREEVSIQTIIDIVLRRLTRDEKIREKEKASKTPAKTENKTYPSSREGEA